MFDFKDYVLTRFTHTKINAFRSEKFLFRIGYNGRQFKVLRLRYGKNGDIYLMPYFTDQNGIVSICEFEKGKKEISLTKRGKVTSSLVKFSHHLSGEALFSTRNERVLPLVRRKSVPLGLVNHHFATVKIQGLEGAFPETFDATTESPINTDDQILTVRVDPEDCKSYRGFKIGFYYRDLDSLGDDVKRMPTNSGIILSSDNAQIGPQTFLYNSKNKSKKRALLLAPPDGFALCDKVMMITVEKIPILSKQDKSCFTMIGGFNSYNDIVSGKKPNEFLAMVYPRSDIHKTKKNLIEMIGTIDFKK